MGVAAVLDGGMHLAPSVVIEYGAPPSQPRLLCALLRNWVAAGYTGNNGSARGSPGVMLAVCTVLCSMLTVLLGPALSVDVAASDSVASTSSVVVSTGDNGSGISGVHDDGPSPSHQLSAAECTAYTRHFMAAAQQLLLHLQHTNDEVALVAADFFGGTYLSALKGLPWVGPGRAEVLSRHAELLQGLTESLVLRTQLKPEVAAVATADARDIPDEARMVRRELAGMLRDISSMVGHTAMLQFMAALVQQGYSALEASAVQTADGTTGSGDCDTCSATHAWVRIECALYAANVVTGRWVAETLMGRPVKQASILSPVTSTVRDDDPSQQASPDPLQAPNCAVDSDDEGGDSYKQLAALAGMLERSSLGVEHPGGSRSSLPSRTSSREALLRAPASAEANAAVRQLVEVAALSTVHPHGSSKLAGTALTLLGGLPMWYARQTQTTMHKHTHKHAYTQVEQRRTPPRRHTSSLLGPLPALVAGASADLGVPFHTHGGAADTVVDAGAPSGGGASARARGAAVGQSPPVGSDSAQSGGDATSTASPGALVGGGGIASLLPSVLLAVHHSLQSADAKLSRNSATTLQRLCAHDGLAHHLLAHHSDWVLSLVDVYRERGGMQERAGPHEDTSTEELLLVTLCRFACMGPATLQLLLRLAAPKIDSLRGALAELGAARDVASASGSVGMASMPLSMGMLASAAAGLTVATLVAQCARALEVLTAIMEACKHSAGSREATRKGGGAGVVRESSINAGSGGGAIFRRAASDGPGSCAQQVLSLVRAVWQVLEPGLKAELVQSSPSSHAFASGVASFMAAAMSRLMPPASAAAAIAVHVPNPSPLGIGSAGAPGVRQQQQQHEPGQLAALLEPLTWSMSVLEAIPVLLLSTPKIADLLLISLDAYALLRAAPAASLSAAGGGSGDLTTDAAAEGGSAGSGGSGTPGSKYIEEQLAACTPRLAGVAGGAVVAGCANLVDHVLDMQVAPSHTTLLLRLCTRCVRSLPSSLVLWPATPDIMLSATLVACYSSDMEQARAALEWCQAMCTAPFKGLPPGAGTGTGTAVLPGTGCDASACQVLCTWLDGTSGATVVQALLLACAGSMPACLILPLAASLHAIWRGVGSDRFLRWVEMALQMVTPNGPAPWQDLKTEHRLVYLQELLSPECASDIPRFKRVVKSLCGGKRKVEGSGRGGPATQITSVCISSGASGFMRAASGSPRAPVAHRKQLYSRRAVSSELLVASSSAGVHSSALGPSPYRHQPRAHSSFHVLSRPPLAASNLSSAPASSTINAGPQCSAQNYTLQTKAQRLIPVKTGKKPPPAVQGCPSPFPPVQVLNMVCCPEIKRTPTSAGRPALRFIDCPAHIFNADKAGLQRHATHGRHFIAPKGCHMPCIPRDCHRKSVTMLTWGNALGLVMSPVFILKGKQYTCDLLELCREYGFTPGVRAKQDSHMMDGKVWREVLRHMAATIEGGVSPTSKALLIVCGHASRLTVKSVDEARTLGFEILILIAHTTHFLQPWDKVAWLSLVCSAPRILVTESPGVLSGAWQKTGLWPPSLEVALAAARASSKTLETPAPSAPADTEVQIILALPERVADAVAVPRQKPTAQMRRYLEMDGLVTSENYRQKYQVGAHVRGKGGSRAEKAGAKAAKMVAKANQGVKGMPKGKGQGK
ncbi:hypothetical protein FOA52_004699 [Chlamydomonas sp. UWO 241]|nr:hypothetical protein FOA52_004699 [Chlamydomonas sp. UWO 241]